MVKELNLFIVTGKIEPEYFYDRVSESAQLIKSLGNNNNMIIISPRRMAKTGLIQYCYEKPEIKLRMHWNQTLMYAGQSNELCSEYLSISHFNSHECIPLGYGRLIVEYCLLLGVNAAVLHAFVAVAFSPPAIELNLTDESRHKKRWYDKMQSVKPPIAMALQPYFFR